MIRDEPTDRQLRVLRLIAHELLIDGYPPTIREIGDELGIASTNGVADHIHVLVRKGFLERRPRNVARGLRLTAQGWALIEEPAAWCPTCRQPIRRAA